LWSGVQPDEAAWRAGAKREDGAGIKEGDIPVTCRELADFIADYLADALPADTRAQFEHHMGVCTNCVTYLDGYKATVELGRHAFDDPDAPVPDTVPEELVKAILAARR
jgi:anti-sigma factor RsiW